MPRIVKLDTFHQALRDAFVPILQAKLRREDTNGAGRELDAELNKCAEIEYCEQCASIFCPWGEPLHFHHDGCPCCSMVPDEEWQQDKADAMLLHNNTA